MLVCRNHKALTTGIPVDEDGMTIPFDTIMISNGHAVMGEDSRITINDVGYYNVRCEILLRNSDTSPAIMDLCICVDDDVIITGADDDFVIPVGGKQEITLERIIRVKPGGNGKAVIFWWLAGGEDVMIENAYCSVTKYQEV